MRAKAAWRDLLPEGRSLPDDVWRARHRGILALVWLESAFLLVFGIVRGYSVEHSALESSVVALAGLAAALNLPRRLRESAATLGVLLFSAILVHLSGGTIEAHFAYFAMLGVVLLYQHWLPFLLYVAFVFLQHAVVGLLDPSGVYNHPAAVRDPWTWALIHATFILAASAALVIGWRRNEILHERAERSYRELYEGEHSLVQVKDHLLQTASHELRTPLTVVLGFTRTLREHWVTMSDREKLDALAVVDRRATDMSRMVDQFLTITQIESGGLVVATSEVDVAGVLEELAADAQDVETHVEARPRAIANVDYLDLILANFLGNARKYGRAPFRVEACRRDGLVEIVVVDHGDGVPSDFVPHLFEKFTQAARSQSGDGFGLGLSLVQTLARAQGGEVGYEPNAPSGARFFVRLRAAPDESDGASAPATTRLPAASRS